MFKTITRLSGNLLGVLKKLVYIVAAFCFVVLGLTGFYPWLVKGEHISGYLMMIHATFAPVFAVCLAVLAVMVADNYRLARTDCPVVEKLLGWLRVRKSTGDQTAACACHGTLGRKVTFWLIVILALPLILSIIASMFPLFGTHWQEILLATHRWTAVAFAVVVIVHTFLTVLTLRRR